MFQTHLDVASQNRKRTKHYSTRLYRTSFAQKRCKPLGSKPFKRWWHLDSGYAMAAFHPTTSSPGPISRKGFACCRVSRLRNPSESWKSVAFCGSVFHVCWNWAKAFIWSKLEMGHQGMESWHQDFPFQMLFLGGLLIPSISLFTFETWIDYVSRWRWVFFVGFTPCRGTQGVIHQSETTSTHPTFSLDDLPRCRKLLHTALDILGPGHCRRSCRKL